MPQLSPLNWLFLFYFHWFMVLLVHCLIWWYSSYKFVLLTKCNKPKHLPSRMFNWK
nr:ATP synthase F0 subunit 8 [Acharax sp. NY-2022]